MVLVIVLVMMAMGSLLMVPLLNYVSTSLKTGGMIEEKIKGLYAAEVGVEDALWKIKNDTPPDFPCSYNITGINGLSVDIEIDEADTIAGEPVGVGQHEEWLIATANVTYDAGNYTYTMSVTNNEYGPSVIMIAKILIELPPGVDYVPSTSSDLTEPRDAEPTAISGSSATGITPVWENGTPRPEIPRNETKHHRFKLSGPPGIEGIEGHGFVEAKPTAMGTVWIMDDVPYSIRSQAKDASGAVLAEIRARVWGSSQLLDISSWQIIP
ncbi:hypothetical protein ES703_83171 [subsurface metagenome]